MALEIRFDFATPRLGIFASLLDSNQQRTQPSKPLSKYREDPGTLKCIINWANRSYLNENGGYGDYHYIILNN